MNSHKKKTKKCHNDKKLWYILLHGVVAHLGERIAGSDEVESSSLFGSTETGLLELVKSSMVS